jgi:hypothetical protein
MGDSEVTSNTNIQDERAFSNRQQLFVRYFTAVLVDLTVLNLFNQYWDLVVVDTFMISLLAAVLLQVLLKVTLAIEHRIAAHFKAQSGTRAKILRVLSAWTILFGSKLLILEAIDLAFGDSVEFGGPVHGLVAFIVVVIAILGAEALIKWVYDSLA